MGTTVQTTAGHMINAQISLSKETMETDLEMDLSTARMGTVETMEIFPVLHRLKGETSHKMCRIANQEVISLRTLLSADLTIDLQLVLRPMNKSFRKNKSQISSNVVRFTTTDDTINELSDFCPLNY